MKEHCYMCNEPRVSDEHIPPLCLFPEPKDLPTGLDLRKNLITVPSCAKHNLRKSGDDEYLLFVLVANIDANIVGLNQWHTKIRRAMGKRPTKRGNFKNPQPIKYRNVNTGAFSIDFERFSRQFDCISRGIYFYHFRESWTHEISVAVPFVVSWESEQAHQYKQAMIQTANLASRFLEDEPKRGENPKVFYYQYKIRADSPGYILRMVFYGGLEVITISGNDN